MTLVNFSQFGLLWVSFFIYSLQALEKAVHLGTSSAVYLYLMGFGFVKVVNKCVYSSVGTITLGQGCKMWSRIRAARPKTWNARTYFLHFILLHYTGEGGVKSTLFCILNHCYFISSPNKFKICHTIKQLYIHNIMPKHENNALQKKIYDQFKKGTFSVECAPCMGRTRHERGVHLIGQWKVGLHALHNVHVISHVTYASPLFSHSNYPLSLHGKTNLYDYQTLNEANAVYWNSCLTIQI